MDHAGKTVLITGGGGGIGGGIAAAFVEAGAHVVLADIDLGHAQLVADSLGEFAMAAALDVTSLDSWEAAKAAVEARFGPVDVLCNNAGISTGFEMLEDTRPDSFARLMAINVTGVYNGIVTFVGDMKARKSGHIVNTSSVNGLVPHGTFAAYSASKFAVTGLSEALRQELEPFGVGVSLLFPGLTRSKMSMAIKDDMGLDDARFAAIEANMMDPLWMGRAVVRAVAANALYIITHPDHLPALEARHAALVAAFGAPAQPGYGATAGAVGLNT
jgi:NAD(P)-dependent dehydrogenase (short-subunit alcohol dehydrogenase family)